MKVSEIIKQDGYYCINDGMWDSPQDGHSYAGQGHGEGISGDDWPGV